MRKKTVAVVGAGFSGAVIAYRLARAGYLVDVYEVRAHDGLFFRTHLFHLAQQLRVKGGKGSRYDLLGCSLTLL